MLYSSSGNTSKHGLFITGTDTGVGKTVIGASLTRALHQSGVEAQPRKPVESGCPLVNGKLIPKDGLAYHHATQQTVALETITPFCLVAPLAPPQAAKLIGQTITLSQLKSAVVNQTSPSSFCLVEGVGGLYSPIANDGLNADLAESLSLPLLIVASDRLGCINHILLTLQAAQQRCLEVIGIVLNASDQVKNSAELDNFSLLSTLTATPIIQTKFAQNTQVDVLDLLELVTKNALSR